MRLKYFLRFTSISTLIIGSLFFVFPLQVVNFFTDQQDIGSKVFVMFLGSSMFGYCALNWMGSTQSADSLRTLIIGNSVALIIACPLSVYTLISNQLNKWGFLILIIHFSFAAGFIYFLKQAPANNQLK